MRAVVGTGCPMPRAVTSSDFLNDTNNITGVPEVPAVPRVPRFQRFGSAVRDVLVAFRMNVAKRYQDLICWQLADELEKLVFELTETGPASKDFKFRVQIMAEGFGRFRPLEHVNFLRIAKSSLFETHNSARTGFNRGYFSAKDTDRMQRLCGRSGKAAPSLEPLEPLAPLEPLEPKCSYVHAGSRRAVGTFVRR